MKYPDLLPFWNEIQNVHIEAGVDKWLWTDTTCTTCTLFSAWETTRSKGTGFSYFLLSGFLL